MRTHLRCSILDFRFRYRPSIQNPKSKIQHLSRIAHPAGGFTFVEILITLLILSIAVTPLMQLYATAIEQVSYTDDLRTALDLAREEVEKAKNLALTEEQIKHIGTIVSPPLQLNRAVWYTVRLVNPTTSPLELQVLVYRNDLYSAPYVSLVTIINK